MPTSPSGTPATADLADEFEVGYAVDLRAVLGVFVRGRWDPAALVADDGAFWMSAATPDGPATIRLGAQRDRIRAQAWGPGGEWLLRSVPSLVGVDDDPSGFPGDLLPPSLQDRWSRLAESWRVPRSRRVIDVLVCAVLEQKVSGELSRRCWRSLLTELGAVAPGPTPRPMRVFPDVDRLRAVPSWDWHRWGVEPAQAATIMRVAQHARRLQECADLELPAARARLLAVPGVGPWSAAEVGIRALGDADAVSVGDYHLAKRVCFAFTGRRGGTDEQMLELLEPFSGQRHRVQRLVELTSLGLERRGPRMSIADHRAH